MTVDVTELRRKAWDSTSPDTLFEELRRRQYRLAPLDGGRLSVDPPPDDVRLIYLIKKHKAAVLERMRSEVLKDPWDQNEADRLRDGLLKMVRAHGTPEEVATHEDLIARLERFDAAWQWHEMPALRRARLDVDRFFQEQGRFDDERGIRDTRFFFFRDCRHERADYYRVRSDLGVAVRRMCPDCGRRLNADADRPAPKRSLVPTWPADGPADPDARVNELIAWWITVEGEYVQKSDWSPGVTAVDSVKAVQAINGLIALWRMGDAAVGLEGQLATLKQEYDRRQAS